MSPIDQDHVDRSELIGLADQLAAPGLIKHKDRAVRVLIACCIANILRLFAPDAPYSIDQFEVQWSLSSSLFLNFFRRFLTCSFIN